MNDLVKKLREDFLDVVDDVSVVDDLISILERDYILLVREKYRCVDCFNCNSDVNYWDGGDYFNDAFCMYYQRRVSSVMDAGGCEHFISGESAARESIARLHCDLTGDWIYDK